MPEDEPSPTPELLNWPITSTLDLHLFKPSDVGDLVPGYLEECRKRGILQVRIIHGKGTGQLRESVHAILKRIPGVKIFHLAPETMGGWGATIVDIVCGYPKGCSGRDLSGQYSRPLSDLSFLIPLGSELSGCMLDCKAWGLRNLEAVSILTSTVLWRSGQGGT